MNELIAKAAGMIEALPFIQRFRNETIVVKFGGSLLDNEAACRQILQDLCFMEVVGLCPVLVHGGGKAISRHMRARNLEPVFLQGLRVTDEATMDCVEEAFNEEINPFLTDMIETLGCSATGIPGPSVLMAEPLTGTDPETGEAIDWGFVGQVARVETGPIRDFLCQQSIPVISPLGKGRDGHTYNINADDAAAAVAQAMKARKLVYLSDVPGLMRDPSSPASIISHIGQGEISRLIQEGVVQGGMIPKLQSAAQSLGAGVNKVHIIDATLPHSLLLELFTEEGVGTEIVHE